MLYIKKYFKFHTEKKYATLIAISDCEINFGVEKIRLKESIDGYNHSDLAQAAFQHFFSWPKIKKIKLKKSEKITIKSFEAYTVDGDYKIDSNEVSKT